MSQKTKSLSLIILIIQLFCIFLFLEIALDKDRREKVLEYANKIALKIKKMN